jgi:glycosyltransferase involved in cell wall biosynthesis
MDAMAIGIPVVATDCSPGGAAFLIKDKKNGLLVKRGEAFAVYEGMKYMIEHPEEADEMGRKALEIEQLLDSEKIEKQWEDYLLTLCDKN